MWTVKGRADHRPKDRAPIPGAVCSGSDAAFDLAAELWRLDYDVSLISPEGLRFAYFGDGRRDWLTVESANVK